MSIIRQFFFLIYDNLLMVMKMNKKTSEFLEEITNNFSTLFVETFYLRYLDQFGEENILKDINYTKDMLLKKIDEKIQQKLESN